MTGVGSQFYSSSIWWHVSLAFSRERQLIGDVALPTSHS